LFCFLSFICFSLLVCLPPPSLPPALLCLLLDSPHRRVRAPMVICRAFFAPGVWWLLLLLFSFSFRLFLFRSPFKRSGGFLALARLCIAVYRRTGSNIDSLHFSNISEYHWHTHPNSCGSLRLFVASVFPRFNSPRACCRPWALELTSRWRYWGPVCRGRVLLAWPSRQNGPSWHWAPTRVLYRVHSVYISAFLRLFRAVSVFRFSICFDKHA
jgi:hypothetical protein